MKSLLILLSSCLTNQLQALIRPPFAPPHKILEEKSTKTTPGYLRETKEKYEYPIGKKYGVLQQKSKKGWASDNDFTGRIPDFIGNNWSKLTKLRLEGDAFEGPIPASFSNLTSLTDLRISGLSNRNPSFDFLRNMKSLRKLLLRNNSISGSMPSNIGEYHSLSLLDLSFNNLTGRIPAALFNLISLTHLFLGDNKLTSSLPDKKS